VSDETRELHRIISASVRDLLDAYRIQLTRVELEVSLSARRSSCLCHLRSVAIVRSRPPSCQRAPAAQPNSSGHDKSRRRVNR
jgi:hypothetical protein